MTGDFPSEHSLPEFSRWQYVKSWILVSITLVGLVIGLWWLFLFPRNSDVYVIQGVSDDCFRKLEATSENGPDEWSMKVCISANNGYVDENGKVIHP
jgi:hypothetical protein